VIAVAPAVYIDKDLCGQVVHLVSSRDPVPWIDFMGRMRNKDTVVVLDRDPEESYFDHSFTSKTYERAIRIRTLEILEEQRRRRT
jgi:hypothetical protein